MAGLKPSVNLFALLDLNDPGDKLVADFDNADDAKKEVTAPKHKKAVTPAANHTKDLLGKAYPSARDYVVRKQQLERQAKAKARAEAEAKAKAKAKANNGAFGDGKSTDSGKVQDGAKVQGGRYYYNNNEASRKQHPGNGMSGGFGGSKRQHPNAPLNGAAPVEAVEAPPAPQKAPPPPPSLYDINEFPSLK